MEEITIIITKKELQIIKNYLAKGAWIDVNDLILKLHNQSVHKEPDKKD